MNIKINSTVLELIQGDITDQNTDAIVNAANASLKLGGGVAGAIKRRGGPNIQQECNKIGVAFTGKAVITTGGKLRARIIHAFGPIHGENLEDEKLKDATLNSLKLGEKYNIKSITFSCNKHWNICFSKG